MSGATHLDNLRPFTVRNTYNCLQNTTEGSMASTAAALLFGLHRTYAGCLRLRIEYTFSMRKVRPPASKLGNTGPPKRGPEV
jgi:hypothetical protein